MKLKHLIVIEVVIILIFAVSLIASRVAGAAPHLAPHTVSQQTGAPPVNHALINHALGQHRR